MANNYWLITIVFFLATHCANAQQFDRNWDAQIARFEAEGQADSAIYYYRLKANYYRQVDSLEAWAYCYYECQFLFDNQNNALAILDSALHKKWRQAKTAGEAEAFSLIQASRGFYLFNLGNILEAIKAQEEGLGYYNKYNFQDFDALEYFFKPLIANYTRLGDNEKARVFFQMAIQGDPSHGKNAAFAGLYNNIGLTYWNEGDNTKAIAYYQKGLDCTGAEPDKIALLQSSLATSLIETNKLKEAEYRLNLAIATLEKMPLNDETRETVHDYLSGAYLTKSRLLNQQQRGDEALQYLRRALSSGRKARSVGAPRDLAKIWIAFGQIYVQRGEAVKAIEAYNQSISTVIPGFSPRAPSDLPSPNQLYPENAIYEALDGKAEALWLQYRQSRDTGSLLAALQCYQLATQTESMLRRALQYESAQLWVLSQTRRRTEKALLIAWELYRLTRSNSLLYTAWTFAEQAKAALLLDALHRNRFHSNKINSNPLFEKQKQLRRQIAYFDRELMLHPQASQRVLWQLQRNTLMDEWNANERKLAAQYPEEAAYRRQTEALSGDKIADICRTLPEYAVIEYFVGSQSTFAFVRLPDGKAEWHMLASSDTLEAAIQQLLNLMQSRTAQQKPGPFLDLSYHVYKQVLQPVIAPYKLHVDRLLIIPDAWLAFVPFETLLYRPAEHSSWEAAPFLIKKHSVHYAFSLAVMERQRALTVKAHRLLLHLSPRFQHKQRGLPPLLAGRQEAPRGSRSLFDEQADWEALSQLGPLYQIVHLSTHAGVDSSGALPRVELFDRAAYLPDIYALNLHADLVVLSACQTALGEFKQGEGVMSLSRAFAYAGAKGLVASLWTINEAATAHILKNMYTRLASGASKPAALHHAKLDYLNDPAVPAFQKSPYYWAALTYVGDNGAVKWKRQQGLPLALLALLSLFCASGAFWWYRRRR